MIRRAPSSPNYQRFHWERSFGPIPETWDFVTLGSLFKERKEVSSNKDLYPLYSFTIEKGVTPKTDRYERSFLLRNKEENEFSVVYPGDFVLNPMNLRFGAIGFSKISKPVLVSAYYNVLIPNKDRIDSVYMEKFLKSHQAFGMYNKIAIGSLLEKRRIHLSILEETFIPLPPLDEQKQIGEVFTSWDLAIEKTERLIKAKEKYLKYLVNKLVSDGTHPKAFVRDIATELSVRNNGEQCQRVLSVTNTNGFILPENQFERRVASEDLSNYKLVRRGQYAYNPSRINVGSIARLDDWPEGVLSPMYVVFSLDENKTNSDFFLYWLSSYEARERIKRSAQGSVRETVGFQSFGDITIPLPSLDTQLKIAELLNTIKKEIDLLKKQLEAFGKQKRGLMQKLLTGEWRLKTGTEEEQ